ncbi:DUF3618 domain-containing protein [Brachybacterium sp. UNK5269]|uniref:DUF3618 domain-containing protein n=1 Tax=Brachybacterium sp. UNK5269 TaxID=3408576 RepID=UPI003BAE77EE
MSTSADEHARRDGGPIRPPDGTRTAPEPAADASPEEIEADIVRTRRELGDTVEALSDKLNPKVQAEQQVEGLKQRAREEVEHVREQARSVTARVREKVGGSGSDSSSGTTRSDAVGASHGGPVDAAAAMLAGAALFAGVGVLIDRLR